LDEKIKSIDHVKTRVISCKLCNLCRDRINAVPGFGNLNSKILFVGEAPGKNEDINGLPFIGNAGKILDDALKKGGIKRSDVYVTNVVKCRPPNNRVPEISEVLTCFQYLKQEIQIISPNFICILGATALQSVLNLKEVGRYHGKVITRDDLKFFITYHPAATIYNNKLKNVFFKEIASLINMMKT